LELALKKIAKAEKKESLSEELPKAARKSTDNKKGNDRSKSKASTAAEKEKPKPISKKGNKKV
jgi:hypothetical protein